jgi:3-oxoacyl-[acyl-carrier protein] reductase
MKIKKNYKKKAIVLGGSKGLGLSIANNLKKNNNCKVIKCSSKDIDTSDLNSVNNFVKKHPVVDILVLNTGGPPNLKFENITNEIWLKFFNQLFLGYVNILNKIKIKNNGYIFNISTALIKEPSQNLIISTSLRIAFTSLLKSLSKKYGEKNVSVISLAPGPFKTNRIKKLVKNLDEFEKGLPLKKLGNPDEIGTFVNYIVRNKIKYISGSTIYFDGLTNNNFL